MSDRTAVFLEERRDVDMVVFVEVLHELLASEASRTTERMVNYDNVLYVEQIFHRGDGLQRRERAPASI